MKLKLLLLIFLNHIFCKEEWTIQKKIYNLSNQPIDIVIACHEKDIYTLDECIKSIIKFVKNKNRIIVISKNKLTDMAEWFSEDNFPFSKKDVEIEFSKIDSLLYKDQSRLERIGWYFKQIINFYAPLIIPDISNNVLILDADIIFNKPIEFVDNEGNMLHGTGIENHQPYFDHMNNLLPGLKKVYTELSGISHHMLFQKPVLEDLMSLVEEHHNKKFWQAYIHSINPSWPGRSWTADYEIYFNFVLMRTNQIKLRNLRWLDITYLSNILLNIDENINDNYDFYACHSYSRDSKLLDLEKKMNSDFNPFEKDENGNNLLSLAAFYNNNIFIKQILKKISTKDKNKLLFALNKNLENSLTISLKKGNDKSTIELLKYYLKDLNEYNDFLSIITKYTENIAVFEKAINLIKKINPSEYELIKKNNELLKISILYGREKIFKKLIEMKFDVEDWRINNETILFFLIRYESFNNLKLIISNDKFKHLINKPDNNKNYPIHEAIKHNLYNITKLFIEYGADLEAKNNDSKNAYELAKKLNNTEILNLLNKK